MKNLVEAVNTAEKRAISRRRGRRTGPANRATTNQNSDIGRQNTGTSGQRQVQNAGTRKQGTRPDGFNEKRRQKWPAGKQD